MNNLTNETINREAFEKAKEKIIGKDRQRLGIGTLSEKTIHAIVKNYYEPDEDHQEIPIENYVADIYRREEIIEIQTRQFNKLRNKLSAFLPLYPVTIVYPIPHEKWIIWIDETTGELSAPRKSPKKGTEYTAFLELYKIKMFLKDPNIRFRFLLMDMKEYKLLNGWSRDKKKGSTRYDRIPTTLIKETEINRIEDYMQFIPYDLDEEFTVVDFAKKAGIPQKLAGTVLHILHYLGLVEHIGKKGRAYLYRVHDL